MEKGAAATPEDGAGGGGDAEVTVTFFRAMLACHVFCVFSKGGVPCFCKWSGGVQCFFPLVSNVVGRGGRVRLQTLSTQSKRENLTGFEILS